MRGSCRYSWMSLVYSSSIFGGAGAAAGAAGLAFLDCANAGVQARANASRLADRSVIRDLPEFRVISLYMPWSMAAHPLASHRIAPRSVLVGQALHPLPAARGAAASIMEGC